MRRLMSRGEVPVPHLADVAAGRLMVSAGGLGAIGREEARSRVVHAAPGFSDQPISSSLASMRIGCAILK